MTPSWPASSTLLSTWVNVTLVYRLLLGFVGVDMAEEAP